MAAPGLIDEYLGMVEARLAHRRDLRELIDEVADHLFESVERAEAAGIARVVAERSALDRFGDPRITASLLASVPTKGFDMNAVLGRVTTVLALLSTVSWLAAMATFPQAFSETIVTGTSLGNTIGVITLFVAVALTSATMVVVSVVIAEGFDRLGAIILVAAILATVFAFFVPWFVVMWGPALAICLAVTIARSGRAPLTRGLVTFSLFVAGPLLLLFAGFAWLVYEGSGWFVTAGEVARERADLVELVAFKLVAAVLVVGLGVLTRRLLARNSSPIITPVAA